METLNEVFNKYGLQVRNNPTNSELKKALHHLNYDLIKSGGKLELINTVNKTETIKMGSSVANHYCYKALQMYASGMQVKDAALFNKKFNFMDGQKEAPNFLLELLMLRIEWSSMNDFIKFIKRNESFVEMAMGQEGDFRRSEIEDYFKEERLKQLFAVGNKKAGAREEESREMVEDEVRVLIKKLSKHENLECLKRDIIRFIFKLMEELVDEERKNSSKK